MTPVARASFLRQRIAVLDPNPRSREHLRRAVRGLGHTPMVFSDITELLAVGRPRQHYAMLCFGIHSGASDVRHLVDLSREIVGRDVPAMFVASGASRALRTLGRIRSDELLVMSSSFSEVFNALEGFMVRHGLQPADEGLAWGRYSFHPACALVKVAGAEVWLDAHDFELALELFHNIDRALTSAWIKRMVNRPPVRNWQRWLDGRIAHLRRQLDLDAESDWLPSAVHCRGYRLHRVANRKCPAPDFSIERFFHP